MRTNGTVLVCATVIACVTIVGAVVLSVTGSDFAEFRATLNTILNVVSTAFGLGGFLYAGSAARSVEEVRGQLETTPAVTPPEL